MLLGLKRRNLVIVILVGMICIILLSMGAFVRAERKSANRVKYVTLLYGVNGKTLSEAEHKLNQVKIMYKTVGLSLEVPAGQINKARIDLAESGIPKAGKIQYHYSN